MGRAFRPNLRLISFIHSNFIQISPLTSNRPGPSTEAHEQQTYLRMKEVFDSSDDDDSPPLT